jgi:ferredoxin
MIAMAFVITRLCRDCVDGACVDACPCDAIVEHRPETGESDLPRQLFINPELCIDCSACLPECPWESIYPDTDVPELFQSDIDLNAMSAVRPDEFHVPIARLRRGASSSEVLANKERWGLVESELLRSALEDSR